VLERRSNLTTAELARNSFVTDQAMADMVTGLDDRGLPVVPVAVATPAMWVIRLTPKGERLLDRFRGPVAALEAHMIYRLTGEQADQLRHHLITCHASLTDTPPRRTR